MKYRIQNLSVGNDNDWEKKKRQERQKFREIISELRNEYISLLKRLVYNKKNHRHDRRAMQIFFNNLKGKKMARNSFEQCGLLNIVLKKLNAL